MQTSASWVWGTGKKGLAFKVASQQHLTDFETLQSLNKLPLGELRTNSKMKPVQSHIFYTSRDDTNVILSPLSRILPRSSRSPSVVEISTASSTTKFINSSKPRILPWILSWVCSYNHIVTSACCWRHLNMRLIGGSIEAFPFNDDIKECVASYS